MYHLPVQIWGWVFRMPNTTRNALSNAKFHYDISNDIFIEFLSEEMLYSCPIWATPEEPLEAAQRRKALRIIQKADIKSYHHVLDIGGGWGFIAMEAVRLTGCQVTVTTLSQEQKSLAEKRFKNAELHDHITYLLCDYRTTPKPESGYDRIISVEMIEAVGRDYLDEYFRVISDLLNPADGKILIQSITFMEKARSISAKYWAGG
jgi:cyclopropane-fatty-acyl-phospholipid synthase